VFLTEVYAETGSYGVCPRFDAVAIGLVPSTGVAYGRVIYEVKVSRSDWLRELRPVTVAKYNGKRQHAVRRRVRPEDLQSVGYEVEVAPKWSAALRLGTEFWVAAPAGVIKPGECPEGVGQLEVRPWGGGQRAFVVQRAAKLENPDPGQAFWAAVLREAARRV